MRRGLLVTIMCFALAGCVQVEPAAPEPPQATPAEIDFTWSPRYPVAGETVQFRPVGTDDVAWDFGDGTSSRSKAAGHAYRQPGTYNVTLQASTGNALTQSLFVRGVDEPEPVDPGNEPSSDPGSAGEPRDPEDGAENSTTDDNATQRPREDQYNGFDDEPSDCSKLIPGPFDMDAGLDLGARRTLDLILLTDQTFRDVHGDAWHDVAMHVAGQADTVYTRELNIDIFVVAVIPIPIEAMDYRGTGDPTRGDSQVPLDQSRAFMKSSGYDLLDRDIVYTLIGADIAGTTAGRAECIGGAKYRDAAYGWGEADDVEDNTAWAGLPIGDKSTAVKVILHELAHVLGAHHHYANCVEHVPDYDTADAFGTCGMMFNDVGLVGYQFSTLNKMAIRGWAEQVDL